MFQKKKKRILKNTIIVRDMWPSNTHNTLLKLPFCDWWQGQTHTLYKVASPFAFMMFVPTLAFGCNKYKFVLLPFNF